MYSMLSILGAINTNLGAALINRRGSQTTLLSLSAAGRNFLMLPLMDGFIWGTMVILKLSDWAPPELA